MSATAKQPTYLRSSQHSSSCCLSRKAFFYHNPCLQLRVELSMKWRRASLVEDTRVDMNKPVQTDTRECRRKLAYPIVMAQKRTNVSGL